ncbi:ABC transporter permease [Mesorhizobium sp. M1A.F.Ca.ET.072.01.1.1]|uniref:ABC transporter permease n=1 Tax=Mesorhizobium sp. M1A.F.Ca.ET.072.01.1.1 TaxID=2496753 RepID=UPI000FD5606C|nr:ABC transporter permease [Mesorhizobium sp. M1A.F.Ca.ET.072.01.1.1]RUW53306.1 ABC transporter permease [Mesorhizobium sp. M1A.F.Ca.ET.072.01.1.1]TIV04020.1 MAG: ABC transporter permease subunit [Mesorhizobium sp.]
MSTTKRTVLLLLPGFALFLAFLALPLANVVDESFRFFEPGRIGSAKDAPYTLLNYAEILEPAYLRYFAETFRFGVLSSLIAIVVSFPIAYSVARQRSPWLRKLAIGFFIGMMFLSTLVRVYALQLTFGSTGYAHFLAGVLNVSPNSRFYTELIVVFGLLHYLIPISVITLLGTIQNLNPRLIEASQVLGASRLRSHLSITLPLCVPGLLSAFLICFTLCLSAFVIPMVLGKGKVLFVSNLIYARFSEIADYPSGSAVAITMLIIALIAIYGITWLVAKGFSNQDRGRSS